MPGLSPSLYSTFPLAPFPKSQARESTSCRATAPPWPHRAAAVRYGLRLFFVAISAALLTYNTLLSSRSGLLPLTSSSFLTATNSLSASSSSSRRVDVAERLRAFHTAVTASGSVYNTWQCRVMYHWFKEAARGGVHQVRILHSGEPDEVMDEIPTFVADPLAEGDQVTLMKMVNEATASMPN